MNKTARLLFSFSAILLVSCGGGNSSSSSQASGLSSSSSATASSTPKVDPVTYDLEALKASYGAFSITKGTNAGSYTYDEENKTYTLNVDTTKAEYILTGFFEGQIVIRNTNMLSAFKGVTISLTNACLVSTGDYPAIYYALETKNVEIKAKVNTSNKVLGLGSDVAIFSGNHVEFSGKGELELASTGLDCHAVRAADEIRFYSAPTIRVTECAHDAFHANYCIFSEDPDVLADNPFAGTMYLNNIVSQAFDCETSSGKGYINAYSGTVYVNNAESVFKTDKVLVVGSNAKIIAANLTGDPYVQGENSSGLSVTINGTFTNDGLPVG